MGLPVGGAVSNPGVFSSAWIVPVDDEHCRRYFLSSPLAGTQSEGRSSEAYNERVITDGILATRRILAGEEYLEDYESKLPAMQYQGLQDQVILASQGRIADRSRERLGKSDKAVVAFRRLWRAELDALAKGARLTEWIWSPALAKAIDKERDWKDDE